MRLYIPILSQPRQADLKRSMYVIPITLRLRLAYCRIEVLFIA
jgi:hypothetical protein